MENNSQTSEDNRDSGLLSSPLSFLRSGLFYWSVAGLNSRGGSGDGYYWFLRSYSTTFSSNLYFHNTNLNPQSSNYRGNGFAVRCVT